MSESPDTEYTPTTDEVRAAWSAWYEPGDDRWAPERFDRWLAAHDAELAALLDERDAQNGAISTLSHTLSEQQQDIEKRDQRIRDLETDTQAQALTIRAVTRRAERAEAERDRLAEQLDRKRLIHVLWDQVPEDWDENDIGILVDAILADTDEGKSEK